MKIIKGECLIAGIVTKNGTLYTKENLKELKYRNKYYPVYNEFAKDCLIGTAKVFRKGNKLLFEARIDENLVDENDLITCKIAPQFECDIDDEKSNDKIIYVKNLYLISLGLVHFHSQDEVK